MSANPARPKPGLLQMESLESRLVPTTGAVCGYVYVDRDNDWVRDPDEGLPGVTMELRAVDSQRTLLDTTTTDANGYYEFTGLDAGAYLIVEPVQPAGYEDGFEQVGGANELGTDNGSDELCVEVGAVKDTREFNFMERVPNSPPPPPEPPPPPPATVKIGGSVYLDADNDGVFDDGEQPIAGVTLTLTGTAEDGTAVTATTTTGADGSYLFGSLPAGTYQVCEAQPAGYMDGKDTPGYTVGGTGTNVAGTVTTNDCIGNITLTPAACGLGNNFGERPQEATGGEGLTPGFWKNNAVKHDGSAWAKTDYFMYQSLGSVFNLAGTPYESLANKTLVQALSLNGGGVNALMRHAVAALLNASHPDVDYPMTTTQIVDAVNAALSSGSATQIEALKDRLDGYNNLGADLDQHGRAGSRK